MYFQFINSWRLCFACTVALEVRIWRLELPFQSQPYTLGKFYHDSWFPGRSLRTCRRGNRVTISPPSDDQDTPHNCYHHLPPEGQVLSLSCNENPDHVAQRIVRPWSHKNCPQKVFFWRFLNIAAQNHLRRLDFPKKSLKQLVVSSSSF